VRASNKLGRGDPTAGCKITFDLDSMESINVWRPSRRRE
jgi:hypothetical protein